MKYIKFDNDIKYVYFCIFIFFTSIYILTISGDLIQADISYIRYDVAESIAERFDLTVREGFGVKGIDGRDYSWIALGSALVSVPFYFFGKIAGSPESMISFVNPIFTSLTAVLLFIFANALGYRQRVSLLITIFFGLGTFAWPLSKQPFDHPIETFFVLLSIFHSYKFVVHKRSANIIFSGAAAGMAFLTRPTSILLLPALTVLILHNSWREDTKRDSFNFLLKTSIKFSISFLPFIGVSLFYNHFRFGSIFETGYSLIAARLGLDFFYGTSLLTGLSGFLISPGKGFFFYSPITIFFFISIRYFHKKHPSLSASFIVLVTSYLLFLSKNIYWHGDWTWGPRYLLVITPFFIIPIGEILNSQYFQKFALMKMVYFTLSVSIILQISAVIVDFRKYFHNLAYVENVNYIISKADGVPSIVEPPVYVYFEINKSPIIAQFGFISEIGMNLIKYYRDSDSILHNQINSRQALFLYDLWWIYPIMIKKKYSFILLIVALLCTTTYCLWKLNYKIH